MALTTYTELKASIADWLHRTDLTTQIVDFITLAEVEINSDLRNRLMEVDEVLSLTISTRTVTIPARYIEPIQLEIVITNQENDQLTYVQPQQLAIYESATNLARPQYYTINGANIEFPNLSDATYALSFRMLKGYDLAATSTNTLLSSYPNVYLYGAQIQAARYMRDLQLEQTALQAYERLITKIKRKEGRSKALTSLRMDMPSMRAHNNIFSG